MSMQERVTPVRFALRRLVGKSRRVSILGTVSRWISGVVDNWISEAMGFGRPDVAAEKILSGLAIVSAEFVSASNLSEPSVLAGRIGSQKPSKTQGRRDLRPTSGFEAVDVIGEAAAISVRDGFLVVGYETSPGWTTEPLMVDGLWVRISCSKLEERRIVVRTLVLSPWEAERPTETDGCDRPNGQMHSRSRPRRFMYRCTRCEFDWNQSADEALSNVQILAPRFRQKVFPVSPTRSVGELKPRRHEAAWSPLEIIGHMRDVVMHFDRRFRGELIEAQLGVSLAHAPPILSTSDVFADPEGVLGDFERGLEAILGLLSGVPMLEREPVGKRSEKHEMALLRDVRFLAHEIHHHLVDLEEHVAG